MPYLVSGGGGAPVYRVKKAETTSRRYESAHHFVEDIREPVSDPVRGDAARRLDDRAVRAREDQRMAVRRPEAAAAGEAGVANRGPRAACARFAVTLWLPDGRAETASAFGTERRPSLRVRPGRGVRAPHAARKAAFRAIIGAMQKALVPVVLALALSTASIGCTTYRDQLVRSQHSFEQNEYERTLGLLRALEPNVTRLATPEQAQYAYLRGMTDYRIGNRTDARHWLAIAKTYDETSPGTLPTDWKARMTDALDEMNAVVYIDGLGELAVSRKPGEDVPAKAVTPAPATPAAK